MAEPILTARGLVKRYGRVTALDNADFDLMPGEILAVIGDNGAGKSSLIKAISGAVIPDEGEIRLEGKPIHFTSPMQARDAGIETVYQNLALSPALSIADNMFMGREIRMPGLHGRLVPQARPAGDGEVRPRRSCPSSGLMTIQNIHQAVETLSGGQRQGVAVARAAAFGSKVIILDEPTAALGRQGEPQGARPDPGRARARHADRADQPQHAARLRGRRPHPRPPPRAAALRHRPEGLHHVRRRRLHDRRQGAAAGGDRGVTPVETLAAELIDRARGRDRFLFAIAGAPGAGKSTLSDALLAALEAKAPGRAALLPMDGYHFDNVVLEERGLLPRKGAPMTFDVGGLRRDLERIRAADEEVVVPVFDRRLELARAGARVIGPDRSIILVEGNYLLLDHTPWNSLGGFFDCTLQIRVSEGELRQRLIERWLGFGFDLDSARKKAEGNDMANALVVVRDSLPADIVWENERWFYQGESESTTS